MEDIKVYIDYTARIVEVVGVITIIAGERVLILGIIVLIRTFLSLSLQVELEGKFAWQRSESIDNATAKI